MIANLLAFVATPVGQALLNVVPTLIEDVIAIWHKSGVITSQDIVSYIASQQSFDALVPKKPA